MKQNCVCVTINIQCTWPLC